MSLKGQNASRRIKKIKKNKKKKKKPEVKNQKERIAVSEWTVGLENVKELKVE